VDGVVGNDVTGARRPERGPQEVLARVRGLALAASLATFALLVVGATVSAAGAGLACPDWPLCHGRLIPPLEGLVLLEYGHRLLASAVGLMVAVLAVLVWRHAREQGGLVRLMAVLMALLAAQVGLGGATVLTSLMPVVVATHLLVAMSFLAVLVTFTARVYWIEGTRALAPQAPPGLRRLAHIAMAASLVQVAIGGFVSALGGGLACPDFPLCHGRVLPPPHPLIVLHYAHRLVAFGIAGLVAAAAGRARGSADPVVRAAAVVAVILVILQIVLGAFNIWTRLWIGIRVAHLAGAGALLSTLVVLTVRARLGIAQGEAAAAAAAPRPARSGGPAAGLRVVAEYAALTKPRIVALLLLTTAAAMVVAAGGPVALSLVVLTLLGGTLAAGAANAINCYWDRDVDALMERTRGRPLPSRRISPSRALAFGAVLAAASVLVLGLAANWLSAALALMGIAYYVGVYTVWLKRSTPHNIVIGGAAGAIPPLVGWAAVTDQVGVPALVLFAIVFLWTPPHFWALALRRVEDYRAARIPMLPVVRGPAETARQMTAYTVALVAASLLMAGLGVLGRLYLVSAVVLGLPFVVLAFRLMRHTTEGTARALFGYSILYLGLLFASMAADRLLG
jgi:protoheme IX farnesyltransferase